MQNAFFTQEIDSDACLEKVDESFFFSDVLFSLQIVEKTTVIGVFKDDINVLLILKGVK